MSFTVVILSKCAANLGTCVRAIRQHESAAPILVVDDGVDWDHEAVRDLEGQVRVLAGYKPFVFARNANSAICVACEDDVILLNDDALLKTPKGFSCLARKAEERPEFGVIASTCNNVGNLNQHQQVIPRWPAAVAPDLADIREDPRMVCFVCVYIPRRTIREVGLLDERFTDYGCEDDDYCLRVRQAGLKIGIYDGCFVDHASLPSQFRGHGGGNFRPNLRRFIEKHGTDNWGRSRETSPFAELFPA